MITEQAVLDVRPGQERDFESAFAEAKALIASSAAASCQYVWLIALHPSGR